MQSFLSNIIILCLFLLSPTIVTPRLFLTSRVSHSRSGGDVSSRSAKSLTAPGIEYNPAAARTAYEGGRNKPLFLESVTARRFPYRWIILAVIGFSFMSLIVVVTIIYANI